MENDDRLARTYRSGKQCARPTGIRRSLGPLERLPCRALVVCEADGITNSAVRIAQR